MQPDGSETPLNEVLWDGTPKSINPQDGSCCMAIGTKSWQAASPVGPWRYLGSMGDHDPDEVTRNTAQSMAANPSDTECPGTADLDGQSLLEDVYCMRTDPNRFGSRWGGLSIACVDAATGRLGRPDRADGVASWAPEPAAGAEAVRVEHDDSITIEPPADRAGRAAAPGGVPPGTAAGPRSEPEGAQPSVERPPVVEMQPHRKGQHPGAPVGR